MNIYSSHTTDKFAHNKYSSWYFTMIDNVISQNRKKKSFSEIGYVYYERHHILPSKIYPQYKKLSLNRWNEVLLTPREHFIAHLLLSKSFVEHKNNISMARACFFLKNKFDIRISSRMYDYIKNSIYTDEVRKQISDSNKGKKMSKQSISKMTKFRRENGNVFSAGRKGKIHTKESIQKMVLSKIAQNNPMFGKNHSEKTKQKISESKIGKCVIKTRKQYEITFPNGEVTVIQGLNNFCKNNNLNAGTLSSKGYSKSFCLKKLF